MKATFRHGQIWDSEEFVPIPATAQFIGGDVMPDGSGGWMPIPPLLNKEEAVHFLRLDNAPNPRRTLSYYQSQGLRGVRLGREVFFTRQDLEAFLREKK